MFRKIIKHVYYVKVESHILVIYEVDLGNVCTSAMYK